MNGSQKKTLLPRILIIAALLCLLFPLPVETGAAQGMNATPSAEAGMKVDWEVSSIFGDELFPSYIVTVAMLNSTEQIDTKTSPDVLGAPYGAIVVRVKPTKDNSTVRIELSSTRFIRKSQFEGTLGKKGHEYDIYPFAKYDYDALLAVRQPVPEDLSVTVWVDGSSLGEKTITMRVRSINECVFELQNGDKPEDVSWTFAAYVNENHPFIDRLLKNALDKEVKSFSGYLGDRKSVLEEIEAIWNAVQKMGMKYSNISTPLAESDGVACQHVRLLGDSITNGQANCVDGTVLFASLLKKIGLNTYLMLSSDHAFLGVDLTEDGKDRVYIETTLVGDSTLEEALEAGRENVREYKAKKDLTLVDVNKWRDRGILPLKDMRAEK